MKNLGLRTVAVLAALMLIALPLCAQAKTRYPELRGTVTDDAGVLSESVCQDLVTLQERLDDADVDVRLYVAVVHFLDGETVQAYADAVFAKANLGEDDVLVLGAAGEDAYAVSAGKDALRELGSGKLNDLFVSSGFASLFATQQYNAAFGAYATAFAKYAGERADETVSVSGLFGQTAQQPSELEQSSTLYNGVTSFDDFLYSLIGGEPGATATQTAAPTARERQPEREGLTPLGWVVLVLLVMLIFGQSDGARRARKVAGCGCSPLGYLVGVLGLGKLLGGRGRRR